MRNRRSEINSRNRKSNDLTIEKWKYRKADTKNRKFTESNVREIKNRKILSRTLKRLQDFRAFGFAVSMLNWKMFSLYNFDFSTRIHKQRVPEYLLFDDD